MTDGMIDSTFYLVFELDFNEITTRFVNLQVARE